MGRKETLDRIVGLGIVPVVRAPTPEDAVAVVDAILAGGIDVVEVTMTVPGAVELIADMARRFGDEVVVGAGTVLDAESARACILAGAQFVVSPIVDEPMLACCGEYGVPAFAGALTPTEIVRAWRAGSALVKVFPCSALGGPAYVKALKAPLPQIGLLPTGGVSLAVAGDFIRAGAAAIGAGADLVDVDRIRAGDRAGVTEKARRYVQAVAEARAQMASPSPEPRRSP
jgi:2-dehydro-3-deoxyphosphogluconate aldolase/(4S)-4-hydroxy-2-oxoglutarate aldolase